MDKDRVKGKMEDIGGRIERETGEWTGDKEKQAEGTRHQIKGKARNAMGQVKDAARDVQRKLNREEAEKDREMERDINIDRERGAA